jgi:signal transduction histidine kinase
MILDMNTDKNIDIDSLEISDLIDIDLLQKFQDNFAESMDIASIIVDREGNPVTKPSAYTEYCIKFIHSTCFGDCECAKSHRICGEIAAKTGKPHIYECHGGLVDFAMPITICGKQIGTILGGQVLTSNPDEEKFWNIARRIGVDGEQLLKSVKKIKIKTRKNIEASVEALFVIANELSKIGYEELRLKGTSVKLESEVLKKSILLRQSEEFNKLKTQQFATVSHELKTPLNIIFSSVQLLENIYDKNESIPPKDTFFKYSNIMKQNCYRLIKITNNLIDMNKIDLGFYSMNFKNRDIVKVVEDISLSVVEFANLKKLEFIFDTDVEEKVISCDSEKLERILLNLLSNAIKFTKSGGNIYVNLYDKGEYIVISVKDTGSGIPKNMVEKIFDNFVQVDNSLRRGAEGSGIGLSLVKSLVEMHGGNIEVKSELGVGSEFIVKLPAKINVNEVLINEKSSLDDKVEKIKIEFSDIYM